MASSWRASLEGHAIGNAKIYMMTAFLYRLCMIKLGWQDLKNIMTEDGCIWI